MPETLGYDSIENEVVDNENSEMVNEIKDLIASKKEDLGTLENESIKNLSDRQLAAYMTKSFFEGGVKSYRDYINSDNLNTLEFCLRAALQILGKNNNTKYNEKGEEASENDPKAKTIDEWLKDGDKGISTDSNVDKPIVCILQKLVDAHVDGKPGPQTIAKTISKLGGDISKYYGDLNGRYNRKELQMNNIMQINLDGTNYNYDSAQFQINENGEISYDNRKFKIKTDENESYVVEIKDSNEVKTDLFKIDKQQNWIQLTFHENMTVLNKYYDTKIPGGIIIGSGNKIDNIKLTEQMLNTNNNKLYYIEGDRAIDLDCANYVFGDLDDDITDNDRDSGLHLNLYESQDFARTAKFEYENGNIKCDEITIERGENNTFNLKGRGKDLGYKFNNIYDAAYTAKLVLYLWKRSDYAYTGADEGNGQYKSCMNNNSPFFATANGLYFSDTHGVTDTDIIRKGKRGFITYSSLWAIARFLTETSKVHPD